MNFDYSFAGVMRSVEGSLERLGLEYLDMVVMHDIDRTTHGGDQPARFRQAIDEGFRALVRLREEGSVKAIAGHLAEDLPRSPPAE